MFADKHKNLPPQTELCELFEKFKAEFESDLGMDVSNFQNPLYYTLYANRIVAMHDFGMLDDNSTLKTAITYYSKMIEKCPTFISAPAHFFKAYCLLKTEDTKASARKSF